MQWLQDNATLLSAFATMFMALVWIAYAQVAITTYLRHRKPRIIIDQTEEQTLDTKFIVVNLSEQPVYVSHLMVAVRVDGDERVKQISKYFRFAEEDVHERPRKVEAELRHGTLSSGDLLLLGDTDQLLAWMLDGQDCDSDTPYIEKLRNVVRNIDDIEIRAIAMVGVEDQPIASYRRFEVEKQDEELMIRPLDPYTHHLAGWRERRTVTRWIDECRKP